MKKVKVISYKNLPAKLPLLSSAVSYLFLDKFNAPGWVWGVVITLFSILWISCVIKLSNEDVIDILNK